MLLCTRGRLCGATSEIHSQADHFKGKTFPQGTRRCPKASRLQDRSVNTSKLNPQAEPLPIRTHTDMRPRTAEGLQPSVLCFWPVKGWGSCLRACGHPHVLRGTQYLAPHNPLPRVFILNSV